MIKFPPWAILIGTLAALVCVVFLDSPRAIVGLGVPPLLVLLTNGPGRRSLGARLLVTSPLLVVALALSSRGQLEARNGCEPALRIVSAVAWSSWLCVLLEPAQMRTALSSLGAPRALLDLVAHTRRFAIQLASTASEAWSAASLRGGVSSMRVSARTAGLVAGVIVVRAFDRAESVAIAGALRGTHFSEDALDAERAVFSNVRGLE